MKHELLLLCLMAHFAGDYYLQTKRLAKIKDNVLKGVLQHSFIYGIPFLFIWFLIGLDETLWIPLLLICVLHLIIDSVKFLYKVKIIKRIKKKSLVIKESTLYLVDQGIHLISIIIICFINRNEIVTPLFSIEVFFQYINIDSHRFFQWILLLLIVGKPINISFKKLFTGIKPSDQLISQYSGSEIKLSAAGVENSMEINKKTIMGIEDKTAGQYIGFLERLLIAIFLSIGQYASIGFIMTAKSIARYDKISKSQEFAEYYLVGTLASLMAGLIIYFFVFSLL
ncbi:DUF3307 domain-containing protein [Anaerocolumna sp.]|uniref:DUF3307 domain-containing protein n=1 Tax=Anaerocolumna sp. TaxID=2041569 RepID=UPI0028A7FE28|nr:DUF3307 domain-containing protein [Anaerocolumna sp.]